MAGAKREYIRFSADENTFLVIKVGEHPAIGGLCVTESQGGCSGSFLNHDYFVASEKVLLRVGKLDTILAEIRWITQLDEDIVKIGFKYLE